MEGFLFLGYGFWLGVLFLFILTLATADVWNHTRHSKYTPPEATKIRVEMLTLVGVCIGLWFAIMLFAQADVAADDQGWRLFTMTGSRWVLIALLVKVGFWLLLFYRLPWPKLSGWKLRPPKF